MPWQSNEELPASVRSALPLKAQTVFRNTANEGFKQGLSEGDAIARAWATVKETWKPGPNGAKWVQKAGARHTRQEYKIIQEIHDKAVELGATCNADKEVTKVKKPLYIKRDLLNADAFITWAKSQGFKTTVSAEELHATVALSKQPVEFPEPLEGELTIREVEGRTVERLGDKGAVVLKFKSSALVNRWDDLRAAGASWDFFQYTPHITITYDGGAVDLSKVQPFQGDLLLSSEIVQSVDDDYTDKLTEKRIQARVAKVEPELGIVFGWAIISKVKGKDYYDTQGDHIPEYSMLRAAAGFMRGNRTAGNMHRVVSPAYRAAEIGDKVQTIGIVLFAFPLTTDIAKQMDIKADFTGLMIGMKVHDSKVLDKFKSGEYTGFSIGGRRLKDKDVD